MLKFKKTFFILTLTFTFLLGISATAFAAENTTQKARIISDTPLNVRSTGSTKGKVLGSVPVGTYVDVLQGQRGSWYYIQSGNLKGWVNPKYLRVSSTPSSSTTPSRGDEVTGQAVVELAKQHLGKPYSSGATGPKSFDCSGFTQYVYKQAGVSLLRTSSQQSTKGATVSKSNLQAGDLVFFNSGGKTAVSHVGIYVGSGKMIHSPKTGDVVKVANLMKNFVTAKRMI